jgi:hypothetical protein
MVVRHENPITEAITVCERWLADLDIERDEVSRLMGALRPLESHYAMVLGVRPKRQVKAVLPAVERAIASGERKAAGKPPDDATAPADKRDKDSGAERGAA